MFRHKFQFEFALRKYLELKMSARSVQMDSEASSQSSDSGQESGPLSTLEKTKAKKHSVQAWIFNVPFKQIFWASRHMKKTKGVTTHEKTNLFT